MSLPSQATIRHRETAAHKRKNTDIIVWKRCKAAIIRVF